MKNETAILNYREMLPASEIKHLVYCFWEFSIADELPTPLMHEIFPDGCVSLIYRRNKKANLDFLLSAGLTLEPMKKEVFPGDLLWGVKFAPSASRVILKMNPAKIETRPIFENNFLPHLTEGLLEKFKPCDNFENAVEIFRRKILSLEISRDETDEKISEAVELIIKTKGEIKIADAAENSGLSIRQLQRRFQKASGLTPKQFVRIQRFRASAMKLAKENAPKLVDVALEMGFTDQAHLTREFASITGRSPKSFAENVKKIGFGDLIE